MKILILLVSGKIKPLILLVISILCIGCGIGRKQAIRDARELIAKSRDVSCVTIRVYLEHIDATLAEQEK